MAGQSVKTWPWTAHDAVELPDGRPIGGVPTSELMGLLVDFRTPGATHENGRAMNIEAYAKHIEALRAAGGEVAVRQWSMAAHARVTPHPIEFGSVNGEPVLLAEWPKKALFLQSLLDTASNDWLVENGPIITVRVKNGFASYRKRTEIRPGVWLCYVGENEYLPAAGA